MVGRGNGEEEGEGEGKGKEGGEEEVVVNNLTGTPTFEILKNTLFSANLLVRRNQSVTTAVV